MPIRDKSESRNLKFILDETEDAGEGGWGRCWGRPVRAEADVRGRSDLGVHRLGIFGALTKKRTPMVLEISIKTCQIHQHVTNLILSL